MIQDYGSTFYTAAQLEPGTPRRPTCADVDDVVKSVHPLDDVHHQVGEAHVVLHDQRVDGLRLHHVVHQVEPLGVLQAALRQAVVETAVVDGAALEGKGGGDCE